jgi:histone-lysine N-methyltransferase SETD2
MADDTRDVKPEGVDAALGDMKLEEGESPDANGGYEQAPTPGCYKRSPSTTPGPVKSTSQSPVKKQSASQTPKSEYDEEQIDSDITVTAEPGKAPKLSRKSSQKVISRPAALFDHVADATEEAISVFQVIKDCIYGSKYMGYSEHDALDCDCSEEWRKYGKLSEFCDTDSLRRRWQKSCLRRRFGLYQPCD